MPKWSQTFQDTFNRANGAPANGWVDLDGAWNIVSNTLQSSSGNYSLSFLKRPIGEALADAQIQTVLTPLLSGGYYATSTVDIGIQSATRSGYICWIGQGSGSLSTSNCLNIGRIDSGNVPPQGIQCAALSSLPSSDVFITVDRVGSFFTATVALNSAPSTILATVNFIDSTYGVGVCGLSPLLSPNTCKIFTVFQNLAPSVSALSVSSNDAVAGIAFAATVANGTSPYTNSLYESTSPPLSPPTTGTLIATTSGSTTSISITAPPSQSSAAGGFYELVTTDANGYQGFSQQAIYQTAIYARQKVGSIFIGYLGDSLTLGAYGTGTTPPQYMVAALAEIDPLLPITISNQAISGTSTNDWIVTGSDYTTAKAAFATAVAAMNPAPVQKYVCIMLGTNDAKISVQTTQATYSANLQGIINDLEASGYIVILNPPLWIPATSSGWNESANGLIQQYRAAMLSLTNGVSTYAGWQFGLEYYNTNSGTQFSGTPPHLNDTGYLYLGNSWASVFAQIIALPKPATMPGKINIALTTYDNQGNVESGVPITFYPLAGGGVPGSQSLSPITTTSTGTNALNTTVSAVQGKQYNRQRGNGDLYPFTAPFTSYYAIKDEFDGTP